VKISIRLLLLSIVKPHQIPNGHNRRVEAKISIYNNVICLESGSDEKNFE
jgi:hypothetical protein